MPVTPMFRPIRAVPTSVPFTYRDGLTMLQLIECIKHNLDSLQEYVNGVMSNVNKALEDQTTQNQDTLDKAQQAAQDAADAIQQAQDALEQYQQIVTNVNTALTTANAAIDRLEALGVTDPEAATELKNTVQQIATDLTTLKNRVTTTETDITKLDGYFNALGVTSEPTAQNFMSNINGKVDKSSLVKSKTNFKLYPHCVVLGDSIAIGLNVDATQRWTRLVCDFYGMTEHNYAVSGTGFVNPKTPNFTQQLQNAKADGTYQKSQVGLVILSGGINDDPTNTSVTQTVSDLFQNIRATYTNAIIICVPCLCGPLYNSQAPASRTATLTRIINGCDNINVDVVYGDAIYWLQGGNYFMQRDLLHPNSIGHRIVSQNVINRLNGAGNYCLYPHETQYRVTANDLGLDGVTNPKGFMFIKKLNEYDFMMGGYIGFEITGDCSLVGKTEFNFQIPLPNWFANRLSQSLYRVHAFNRMSKNGGGVETFDNAVLMGNDTYIFVVQTHETALVAGDKCEVYIPPTIVPTIGYNPDA